jgi:hypothetical protein
MFTMTWNLAEVLHSLAKRNEYKRLRIATKDDLGDFQPIDNDCHGNARRWIAGHPQHKIIAGFLIKNDDVFCRHSVIDTGDSALLDISPRPRNESAGLINFIELDVLFKTMPAQVIHVVC